MLDSNLFRNDLESVVRGLASRGFEFDQEAYRKLDSERRRLIQEAEVLKAERNRVSDEVAKLKRAKADASHLIAQQREVGDKLKALENAEKAAEAAFRDFLSTIPNVPHGSVPVGSDEHGNVEIKRWGKPAVIEAPRDHVDLGTRLGILDLDRAARMSGARFSVLKGWGARLERALINFMADRQSAARWAEVMTPYMVLPHSVYGVGQLPKFEEDLFKTKRGEDTLYLISTAEVPVTNLYREEILPEEQLPIRHCAFSPCFRSEAGSYGKDTRGLIRQHQFNKVELVKFSAPETSYDELEKLTLDAEDILKTLGLHFRTVSLCTADLGFSSSKTYDLEVWLPGQNVYREISSCSNFEDFQARRASIRFRREAGGKVEFVHTLNGSGLAVGRTVVAILENYQQKDGSVVIPEPLRPYMRGLDKITL